MKTSVISIEEPPPWPRGLSNNCYAPKAQRETYLGTVAEYVEPDPSAIPALPFYSKEGAFRAEKELAPTTLFERFRLWLTWIRQEHHPRDHCF